MPIRRSALVVALLWHHAALADWTQHMGGPSRTGVATGSAVPSGGLRLLAAVPIGEAILGGPVIADGIAYVADQMGGLHAVDLDAARILWSMRPPAAASVGSATSGPAVAGDVIVHPTPSGHVFLVDRATGEVRRTIDLGAPAVSPPLVVGDAVYVTSIDATIHAITTDGRVRWRYSHNDVPGSIGDADFVAGRRGAASTPDIARRSAHPGDGSDIAHYGGGAMAASGGLIVAALGYDIVALRDRADGAGVAWRTPAPVSTYANATGISIEGGFVYVALPRTDGRGEVLRLRLEDGAHRPDADRVRDQWAVLSTPAVRDERAYFTRHCHGLASAVFGEAPAVAWTSFGPGPDDVHPAIAPPVLVGDHAVIVTLAGELKAVPLEGPSSRRAFAPGASSVRIPSGSPITSAPAVSDGMIVFGADDGFLFIAGTGEARPIPTADLGVWRSRSGHADGHDWPSSWGSTANDNRIADPRIAPPFRLRWAVRDEGYFKHPPVAVGGDLFTCTLGGFVACREQETGRLRWRTRLAAQAWSRATPLAADGRLFVPRVLSPRYPVIEGQRDALFCLDQRDGRILWSADTGGSNWLRASPVLVDGVVAYGSFYWPQRPGRDDAGRPLLGPVIEAFDAASGERLWQLPVRHAGEYVEGPAGAAFADRFIFSGGGTGDGRAGETLAIEPRSGRVLWRNTDLWVCRTGAPAIAGDQIILSGAYGLPVGAIDARTGATAWANDDHTDHLFVHPASIGDGYFTVNNKYSGGALRWSLDDGQPEIADGEPIQLFGKGHACGSVLLTTDDRAISATMRGVFVCDAATGDTIWRSPAFASKTCPHPIAAGGRLFFHPQNLDVLFCFEPVGGR